MGVSFGAGVTCWIFDGVATGCGAGFVSIVVVVEGFSKEANNASKSLSGEAFLGASLCVVETGVDACVVSRGADSVEGPAVESEDHHQPMICCECVCGRKKSWIFEALPSAAFQESARSKPHVTSLLSSNFCTYLLQVCYQIFSSTSSWPSASWFILIIWTYWISSWITRPWARNVANSTYINPPADAPWLAQGVSCGMCSRTSLQLL